jgi:ABC-type amino acid transport substrate-binding protein
LGVSGGPTELLVLKPNVTRTAPVLTVGAALPDPPFELMTDDSPAGFDIALMQRIAGILGRKWQLVPYKGTNFNDIFAGLDDGTYDCIASGTTITPGRSKIANFCRPTRSRVNHLLWTSVDIRTYMASATLQAWIVH